MAGGRQRINSLNGDIHPLKRSQQNGGTPSGIFLDNENQIGYNSASLGSVGIT